MAPIWVICFIIALSVTQGQLTASTHTWAQTDTHTQVFCTLAHLLEDWTRDTRFIYDSVFILHFLAHCFWPLKTMHLQNSPSISFLTTNFSDNVMGLKCFVCFLFILFVMLRCTRLFSKPEGALYFLVCLKIWAKSPNLGMAFTWIVKNNMLIVYCILKYPAVSISKALYKIL